MTIQFWCPLRIEAAAARRGAANATVARTGMGPRRAADFAAARSAPRAVVLGLAGACGDSVGPGEVVVADVVHGPGTPRRLQSPDVEAVEETLTEAGLRVVRGGLVSTDGVVVGKRRHSIGPEETLAADMESWWLLGADPPPLAVVRVISDGPDAGLASFSLPWRVRQALRAITRLAAALESLEVQSLQPGGVGAGHHNPGR